MIQRLDCLAVLRVGTKLSQKFFGYMRVLLLLPYAWDTAPGQRYRIEQWHPWLTAHGVTFHTETLLTQADQKLLYSPGNAARKALMLASRMAQRVAQIRDLRSYDAIWLYRCAWPIGPAWLEGRLARSGVPLIYEFDDAIYLTQTSQSNRHWQFLKFSQKTSSICRIASHVVVGNQYLADYARQFNPAVTVVPTTIDTDQYQPRNEYSTSGPITVGWSGSTTTLAHFRLLEPVLQRVAREEQLRVQVIGVPDYRIPKVQTDAKEWRPERQAEELRRFDIGVMPLPDEPWVQGKCGCKALEYMAVGVPTIVSPVGVNEQIVTDRQNGLLARTEDEWVDKLLLLARDVRLREQLGRAGRITVEGSYAATTQAPRVLELLQQVTGKR